MVCVLSAIVYVVGMRRRIAQACAYRSGLLRVALAASASLPAPLKQCQWNASAELSSSLCPQPGASQPPHATEAGIRGPIEKALSDKCDRRISGLTVTTARLQTRLASGVSGVTMGVTRDV